MKILVVEDERRMADLLRQGLSEEGHSVSVAPDGPSGLAMAQQGPYDVIVMDVMLPGMDGFAVSRRLRAAQNHTPILLLTARDSAKDIVQGLDQGADDYLTKPFSFEVLFARVRALGRRSASAGPAALQAGDLTLNPSTREVKRGRRQIHLTRTEFAMLELMLRHVGHVLPRAMLIERIWGPGTEIESNTLDAFIRLLRTKVETGGESKLIRTVWGVGYSLKPEDS